MVIDAKVFNDSLETLEIEKGVSKDVIIEALKEALIKGVKRDIGFDDALVYLNFDIDAGVIDMAQIKHVVQEVEDDVLEISIEEANENSDKKYVLGDEYYIPVSVESLRKAILMSIKSVFRQKFAEAEKGVLLEQFKDKINTMITGKVESFDPMRGATINIGRTSVFMPRKEMIKDEKFLLGETIKLFVSDVDINSKGARIVVSRANEAFLKALMTEEIHDIYDGTISIVACAREAGERSKVAVYSDNLNVDPAGSCIGPNGSRIQRVVSQLGNGSSKEKIDIISYSENTELFVMEALKPAVIIGINLSEDKKSALVVVDDNSLSLAIGKKGINVRLAVKLTGIKIDVKTESQAKEMGLEYKTFEEISAHELEEKAKRIAEKQKEILTYQTAATVLPGLPEGYVAPQARSYEDDNNDLDEAIERLIDKEDEIAITKEETKVDEVSEAKPVVEEVKETVKPVETKKEETTEVKTTTTLEDLEKSLESSKNTQKTSSNKRKKKEEKVEEETVVKNDGPRMSIYTEEELKEIEEEENNYDDIDEDDDIDYDEYDDYYDDK